MSLITLHIIFCVEKCIALMEDIDAAFSLTINRETNNSPKDGDKDDDSDSDNDKGKDKGKDKDMDPSTSTKTPAGLPTTRTSGITLSGLLNALDGVGAQEGRILFATTNKYHSLDPALCRPGRMDIHMEFKLASRHQARELFRRFYMSNSELEEEDGYSIESERADRNDILIGDTLVSDTKTTDDTSIREGHAGRHAMRVLLPGELEKFAEEFADAIPVGEFSMASLQGYLMKYKVNPEIAVKEAAMWVTKEREESQRAKGKGKTEEPDGPVSVQPEDADKIQPEASDKTQPEAEDKPQPEASDTPRLEDSDIIDAIQVEAPGT